MNTHDPSELDNFLLETGPAEQEVAPLGVDAEEIRVYDNQGNLVGTIDHAPLSCLENE